MKNYQRIIYATVCILAFFSFANAQPAKGDSKQSAPETLELLCRGGNNFAFAGIGSKTHSTGAVIAEMEMVFSPALQAAGSNAGGLEAGQCGLVNRAFSRDEGGLIREPLKVRFETPANSQLKQTQSGSQVDRSPTAAEIYPDAITIPIYLLRPNQYWIFKVINSGRGYYIAKSHSHWKKRLDDRKPPKGIFIR